MAEPNNKSGPFDSMSERDRKNLEWLLSISKEELTKWFETAEPDDALYAKELMDRASMMMIEFHALKRGNRETTWDTMSPDVKAILGRFRK